jgi:hypothetical protein
VDLNWLAPTPPSAQPLRYATSSWVAPENLALSVAAATASKAQEKVVFPQWNDAVPDWSILRSNEMIIEIVERKSLRGTGQSSHAPFVGCGKKHKPTYILSAIRPHAVERPWRKKCGSERGVDSGQYFTCPDCAVLYGYLW